MDTYSDYVEVMELEDLTTETLIAKVKQIFATHGIPIILISNNGPNYASKEVSAFASRVLVQVMQRGGGLKGQEAHQRHMGGEYEKFGICGCKMW